MQLHEHIGGKEDLPQANPANVVRRLCSDGHLPNDYIVEISLAVKTNFSFVRQHPFGSSQYAFTSIILLHIPCAMILRNIEVL